MKEQVLNFGFASQMIQVGLKPMETSTQEPSLPEPPSQEPPSQEPPLPEATWVL